MNPANRQFLLGVLSTSVLLFVAVHSSPAAEPTYWQDVRPIFRKHCTVCHSERNLSEPEVSAGLALDSYQAARKGAKHPVIVAGKANESRLVQLLRIADENRRMPLDAKPLPDSDVALIRRWIDAGAPEGTRPSDIDVAPMRPSGSARRRKLPIVLPTRITRPAAVELVLPAGPLSPVAAVAYSPDAGLLAAGSYGCVTIWSTRDAKPVASISNVLGAVNDLKFSPDGAVLAVAGGQPSARGDLRLFDTRNWKLITSLGGHLDVVASVSFRPDGKRLASASFDKSVRLWNMSTHQVERTLTGHSDFVYSVAFGPKGNWLVSASKDRTVRLSDAATGKSKLTFSGMDQDVLAVAVAPNSSAVISSGYEPALFWWNPQTGERVRRQGAHDVAVHELAFDRSGKIIVSAGGDKTVRWFNGTTGAPIRSMPAGAVVYAVAVRPDGQQVAAGCADGLVRIFDIAGVRQLLSLIALPGANRDWLALAPEGYAAGSVSALTQTQWRAGAKLLPGDAMRKALVQPEQVAKAWRGEKIGDPALPTLR